MVSKALAHLRRQWIGVLALFLVLSGGSAIALDGHNTVFSDDIVNGEVKQADLKPAEAWREVGAAGEPGFQNSWSNFGGTAGVNEGLFSTAAFYRDPQGVVHLKGLLKPGTYGGLGVIFRLPAGYRPALSSIFLVQSYDTGGGLTMGRILITGEQAQPSSGTLPGNVKAFQGGDDQISLDGITFRCAPSGQNGCP